MCPCAWIHFAAFVSVVSSSFPVSACKVINYKPNKQIILKKSFIKNCKRTNKAFFLCALLCVRLPRICYKNIVFIYVCACLCVYVRAYVCALRRK